MFAVLNIAIPFLVGLFILFGPGFLIVGGIFFFSAKEKTDLIVKKKWRKWGGWTMAFPFIAIFLLLILWGLANVIQKM